MFQSWSLSQKIGRQGQKNVIGGTFPSYFAKLFVILYGLVKMTSGCYAPESVPEKKIMEIRTIYPLGSNHTQCYNMPSGHKFAFKISTYLPQLTINVNDTVMASVLEEYYHYAYLFEKELEEEIRKMEFTFTKRTQILLATIIKENNRKVLWTLFPYLVLLALAANIFGYKAVLLIIFATNLIQTAQAKPTTVQNLYRTLAYVQLRKINEWLTFTEDEYLAMETGLRDAIIRLQQLERPPPPKVTTMTEIPMTNDQLLAGILHSFIERSDEKEETKRQEQQEMIYATE
jgi:hypothetical protein